MMPRLHLFFFLLIALVSAASARATNPSPTAATGHEAAASCYAAGDWAGAEAALSESDAATWRPETLLLLGHAQARQEKTAAAMLSYRRVLALRPGQPEAAQNLSVLSRRQGVLEPPPPDPWSAFFLSLSPGVYSFAAAVSFWSIAVGIAVYLGLRPRRAAMVGLILCVCGSTALVLTGTGRFWKEKVLQATVERSPLVWLPDGQLMVESPLFAEPARGAGKVIETIPAGTPLRLIKQEAWSYVEVPRGDSGPPLRGWLPNSSWLPLRRVGDGGRWR